MQQSIEREAAKNVEKWISKPYDQETIDEVIRLRATDSKELIDCMYKDLSFGTGGIRGLMGVGTNRLNKYTIAKVSKGLANYLSKNPHNNNLKAAIAYDSRKNSQQFARVTADILSANKIKVYLFDELTPVPLLSFAIRYLNCDIGIMITASHNPKEYNGYKIYWKDGSQISSPHDKNIALEIEKIDIEKIHLKGEKSLIEPIGEEVRTEYVQRCKKLSLNPSIIRENDISIVYTSLHGTGIMLVPRLLKELGFNNVHTVNEQCIPDENFSTVKSPNPEEPESLSIAIKKAVSIKADIVLATDPDSDRVNIAFRISKNDFYIPTGNQIAAIIFHYLFIHHKKNNKNSFIAKTIVTSDLIEVMAKKNAISCYTTLTGFKYIGELIAKKESTEEFIGGCEESYGYLIGSSMARDKDAISTIGILCEIFSYLKHIKKTPIEWLMDIYLKYGLYREKMISFTLKGIEGIKAIQDAMTNLRNNPPLNLNNSRLLKIRDYLISKEKQIASNHIDDIDFPTSNVIQLYYENNIKLSIRPSGTEPKIKIYASAMNALDTKESFNRLYQELGSRIDSFVEKLQSKLKL